MNSLTEVPLTHNVLELKKSLLAACKILVMLKLDSCPFGNLSIRIPNTQHFIVTPSQVTFQELEISDLVMITIDGVRLNGKREPHPGTFIHREIYRLRSDVDAIVHTHSDNTVFMSLLGVVIAPYTQLGAAIHNDQGIYHGFSGPVRTTNEGAAIAEALSEYSIVIAKNHGIFTTGKSLASALWDMVIVDQAAKIHLQALKFGLNETTPLSSQDFCKSKVEVRDKQCESMWEFYLRECFKHKLLSMC